MPLSGTQPVDPNDFPENESLEKNCGKNPELVYTIRGHGREGDAAICEDVRISLQKSSIFGNGVDHRGASKSRFLATLRNDKQIGLQQFRKRSNNPYFTINIVY